MKISKFFISTFIICFISSFSWSEVFFSGFAGGKIDFLGDKDADYFDSTLNMQTFFAGQLNLSENIIAHGEFSIKTGSLISDSIFKETDAKFQFDELSLIFRGQMLNATNYFSIFAGTYEPIGSDIFLRRQFGIQPISSKITESWLGLAGSVIYPLFGAGIADIIHFDSNPIATGVYAYVNHEIDDCYVLNFDARFACVYRYFTFDIATGLGFPLKTKEESDAYIIIDTLYWRAGMNMLIGNSQTTSLFIQAGVSKFPFSKADEEENGFDEKNSYILFEPRFKAKKFELDMTFYSLPQETADSFIFINNTLGLNFNVYTDNLYIKNQPFIFGINTGLSFHDKTFLDLGNIGEFFESTENFSIDASPYLQFKLFNGELHTMLQIRAMDMVNDDWYKGFTLSVGYKTQF